MSEAGPSKSASKLDRGKYRPETSKPSGVSISPRKSSAPKGNLTDDWSNPFGDDDKEESSAAPPPKRSVSVTMSLKGIRQDSFSPEKRDRALSPIGAAPRGTGSSSRSTSNRYDTSPAPRHRPLDSRTVSPVKFELPARPTAENTSGPSRSVEKAFENGHAADAQERSSSSRNGHHSGRTEESRREHGSPQDTKRSREGDDRYSARSDRDSNGRDRGDGSRRDPIRGTSRERPREDRAKVRYGSPSSDRAQHHDGFREQRGGYYENASRHDARGYQRNDDRGNEYTRYDSRRDDGRYQDSSRRNGSGYRDSRAYDRYDERETHKRPRYDDDRWRDDRPWDRDRERDRRRDDDRVREGGRDQSRDRAARQRSNSPRRRTISGQSHQSADRSYGSQGANRSGETYRPDDRYPARSDRARVRSPPAARGPATPVPAEAEEGEAEEGEISEGEIPEAAPAQSPARGPVEPRPKTYMNGVSDGGWEQRQTEQRPRSPVHSEHEPYTRPRIIRPIHRTRPTPPLPARPDTPPPPPPPADSAPPTPPTPPAPPAVPQHPTPPPPPSIPTGPRNPHVLPSKPGPPEPVPENPYLISHRKKMEEEAAEVQAKRREEERAAHARAHAKSDRKNTRFSRRSAKEEKEVYGRRFKGITTMADYDMDAKIGEGTFGVVTKAKEKVGGRMVALKKLIAHNPRDGVSVTTVREIKILKSLHHDNVVPLLSMVVRKDEPNDRVRRGEVFMVFPYMDHDLCGLLANTNFKLPLRVAKLLMKQLLEGLAFIHANNFIHRDIKTANILVDRRGQAMIADFGLARSYTPDEDMPKHAPNEYTNMVVTRWYRAPELLLGASKYTQAVDLWSAGCILGELWYKQPIIAGHSDLDQLQRIVATCGPLNEETWPTWRALPGFPDEEGKAWDRVLPEMSIGEILSQERGMDRLGVTLLMKLLTLDPEQRLTAEEALDDIWFHVNPLPATVSDDLITVESSHEMTIKRPEPPPAQRVRPRQSQNPGANPYMSQPKQQQQSHHIGAPPPAAYGQMQPQQQAGMPIPMSHMPPHGRGPIPTNAGLPQGMPPGWPGQHPQAQAHPQQPYMPGPSAQINPYGQQTSHANPYGAPPAFNAQQPVYPPGMPPAIPPNPYNGHSHGGGSYDHRSNGNSNRNSNSHSGGLPGRPGGLPQAPRQPYASATGLPSNASRSSVPAAPFKLAGAGAAPGLPGRSHGAAAQGSGGYGGQGPPQRPRVQQGQQLPYGS